MSFLSTSNTCLGDDVIMYNQDKPLGRYGARTDVGMMSFWVHASNAARFEQRFQDISECAKITPNQTMCALPQSGFCEAQ